MIAKTTGPGLWADTSETLNLSQYEYLARSGYRGCFRYVPLAGGHGGITLAELQAALSVKCPDGSPFAIQFVQFARSNGINAASGAADGQAAAEYLKTLGVPPTVCIWQDLDAGAKADCIAYSNASYAAMIQHGVSPSAPGMYAEPGYPLTAQERYDLLNLHRYWATAANDPNKMVAHRGCQIIQGWGSPKGEIFPIPGLVIDVDLVQSDYFNSFPVAVIAG